MTLTRRPTMALITVATLVGVVAMSACSSSADSESAATAPVPRTSDGAGPVTSPTVDSNPATADPATTTPDTTAPATTTPVPAAPDTSGIVGAGGQTIRSDGSSWNVEFYRNEALTCGRHGVFSFALFEPRDDTGGEAPLWVFLHGGGIGYYNDEDPPRYLGDEEKNDEESLDDLVHKTVTRGEDTTLTRRLSEGWRVLVPSMCDHDLHAGEGTPYPNNPNHGAAGDTADGLLANEAALTWVAQNRPTTWVVAYGTSAGSVGSFALAYAMHERGVDLNAAIADSILITPRLQPYMDAGVTPQTRKNADFDVAAVADKVGRFGDAGPDGVIPERVVAEDDFRAVPILAVVGELDPHCAGEIPPLPAAEDADNCEYVQGGFAAAVDAQVDSPHGHLLVPDGGHTTTRHPGPVNDQVDAWLMPVLGPDAPHPFG